MRLRLESFGERFVADRRARQLECGGRHRRGVDALELEQRAQPQQRAAAQQVPQRFRETRAAAPHRVEEWREMREHHAAQRRQTGVVADHDLEHVRGNGWIADPKQPPGAPADTLGARFADRDPRGIGGRRRFACRAEQIGH